MELLVKATVIDGIAATEDRDSQGEILKLSGADISQMTTKGYFNDNHGTGFLNTLGRITEAKKIFKQDDCASDRQRYFWDQKKRPFLYVKGYLFDDADHPNAKAVGAIMKEFQKMGTPLDVKYSVEGKVLDRASHDRSILAQSMVRNVALTLVPANGETAAGIAGRIAKSMDLIKSESGAAVASCVERFAKSIEGGQEPRNRWDEPTIEERADTLYKKIVALTDLIKAHKKPKKHRHVKATLKHEAQRATEQGKVKKSDLEKVKRDKPWRTTAEGAKIYAEGENSKKMRSYNSAIRRKKMETLEGRRQLAAAGHFSSGRSSKVKKMLSPGYGGAGAPAQLTGGAALTRESLDPKRKALKEVIKSTLAENPGVSLAKALEMVLSKWRQRFG